MMERHVERDLEILTAIGEGRPITQRDLAQRLGVALGLTNLYLKRLAQKGFIKITEFPKKPAARKRLRYLLTAKGLAEKSRLTYEHVTYSLNLYRRARQTLRESFSRLPEEGYKRIVLYGTGEAAELAYLSLKEFGLEPVGIFAREAGGQFLGFPVRAVSEMAAEDIDAVIMASFEPPDRQHDDLTMLHKYTSTVLTLRRTVPAPKGNGGGE